MSFFIDIAAIYDTSMYWCTEYMQMSDSPGKEHAVDRREKSQSIACPYTQLYLSF